MVSRSMAKIKESSRSIRHKKRVRAQVRAYLTVVAFLLGIACIAAGTVMLMRGKILERSFTRHERTDAARFDFDEPTTIQADGELYDGVPFHVRVVPGGLNIYRP